MRRPFVYFTIPMILGIIFYYYIEINIYFILALLILTIIISLIKLRLNHSVTVELLTLFFLLGIILPNLKINSSQLIKYTDTRVVLEGSVKDIKKTSAESGRYVFLVDDLYHNGIHTKLKEKLILKVIGEKKLEIGDRVNFDGILKEPQANTNPKLFNYKTSLLTENIYTTATIKDYAINNIMEPDLSLFLNIKKDFISRVEDVFDKYLIENNSSLMKSIVLGNSSYLDEENIVKFRDLGLAHILAVSGLHIGIISGILITIFAYLGIDRKVNITLAIIILWFYAYIVGYPPSVLRANIMFTLLLFSQVLAEAYDSINILFLALFVLIIINPFWIFSIGFQLSFAATFFIIYLTPKISTLLYRYNKNIIKSISGILSVQIGLLPIQSYYFNRIPILSIFANLLLVPIFSISLILSIFLIPISFISNIITSSLGIIINFLLNIQFYIMEMLFQFPYLNLKLPSFGITGFLIYYSFVFIILGIINLKNFDKGINKAIVFYLLFLIIINVYLINTNVGIDISFIDVGQGDSILINTREGHYLIDTGGNIFGDFDIGENILLPFLEKRGIFKLKGVFITHFDADHCKSLPYLINNIKIENIYLGYKRDVNPLYEGIKESAFNKDIPIYILKKGDKLKLDNNTKTYVLGPDEKLLQDETNKENDLSLVLLINYFDKNILLTGDIEEKGEKSIINSLNSKVDFLKVPHHGSKTSSGLEFLEKLAPKVGFISVGRNNNFGHPNEEVINRYKDKSIDIYRTDQMGFINLNMEKENYKITSFLKEKLSILYIIGHYGMIISYFIIYFIISYILIRYFALLKKEMETIEL